MCGIYGIITTDNDCITQSVICRMGEVLRHRGPDDGGFMVFGNVLLGHRRLSIIDIGTGHQPVFNEDRTVAIVFNGEIYNFHDLRDELFARGHVFTTRSDTETIVHLYEEYGVECLRYLNGMFAVAIWDARRRTLFVARDRFGIKPVVYYQDENRFIFSSEIKGVLQNIEVSREMDWDALSCYLSFGYIPAPLTIYKGIKKLEPGHYITLKANGKGIRSDKVRYYDLADVNRSVMITDLVEAKAKLREALDNSVRGHMISDVPLGAFLSGGIDSSVVVGLMARASSRPVKTFSIGYEGYKLFDETDYAREVAAFNGTEHHEFKLGYRDILDIIPTVLDNLDEPFSDWSVFPTYLVSRETKSSVKVALSGDGADEIFGGYSKHLGEYLAGYYMMLPRCVRKGVVEPMLDLLPDSYNSGFQEKIRKAKRLVSGISDSQPERHFRWMQIFTREHKERLMKADKASQDPSALIRRLYDNYGGDPVNKMLYSDVMFCLPYDMLTKVDLMSMLNSLETRVPFLDHRVVELAFSMAPALKLKGLKRKRVLVESFKDILPPKLHSRPKQGFNVPIGEWFKHELKDLYMEVVNRDSLQKAGIFDYTLIEKMFADHVNNRRDYSKQLLCIFNFQWWLSRSAPSGL